MSSDLSPEGKETADSDVDLLEDVTGEPTAWFPGGLVADLEELLGKRVQVIIQILGESTQRLMESSKMRHPEVDWRGISGLSNVLVHDYFEVDLETIRTIIQRDLPVLESAVRRPLEDPRAPSSMSNRLAVSASAPITRVTVS